MAREQVDPKYLSPEEHSYNGSSLDERHSGSYRTPIGITDSQVSIKDAEKARQASQTFLVYHAPKSNENFYEADMLLRHLDLNPDSETYGQIIGDPEIISIRLTSAESPETLEEKSNEFEEIKEQILSKGIRRQQKEREMSAN